MMAAISCLGRPNGDHSFSKGCRVLFDRVWHTQSIVDFFSSSCDYLMAMPFSSGLHPTIETLSEVHGKMRTKHRWSSDAKWSRARSSASVS
jgi:hypothetical protein